MNAPLPSQTFGQVPVEITARRAEQAAHRIRTAIAELRAAKTSIGKGRGWLPACGADLELQLEVRKLFEVEKAFLRIARRLEAIQPAEPPEAE